MMWIEYDYICNENKGITYRKKLEYNETNLAIAHQEAVGGFYTITEDDEVVGVQPLAIGLGGTNAKTAEEACKNIGGINTYTHGSSGLIGMGVNGKFKATMTDTISSIKVNGTTCSVKCGEDASMDLVAGCWYTFIRDGNVINFNAGGAGGGGLELKIVGGTTRPQKPSQNMIWINTPNEITRCALQSVEPVNPVEGMVCVFIGNSGSIKVVSPVGGDWITVYPISAKQYIGGAWVDKLAKSYQDGKWVDWWNGELYQNGNQYENVTGGWSKKSESGASVTFSPAAIEFTGGFTNGSFHVYTQIVDLSDFTYIVCEGTFDSHDTSTTYPFVFGLAHSLPSGSGGYPGSSIFMAKEVTTLQSGDFKLSVPIADVNASGHIVFGAYYANGRVKRIYAK